MLKSKKSKKIATSVFLLLEFLLFLLVQKSSGIKLTIVSYFVVILSSVFLFLNFEKTREYILMQIASITTLLADYFLVVLNPIMDLPAMCFFSLTQICYFLRLYFESKNEKEKRLHLIFWITFSLLTIGVTLLILNKKTDTLSLVSMFYYINLVLNVIFAFLHFSKSKALAIGLLLFLLCDTVIGLNIMAKSYITSDLIEKINRFLSKMNWAWFFYVPSQALLAISLIKLDKEKSSI